MSSTWVVPGPPLPKGAGWRIWYSRPGNADFAPAAPQISRAGQPITFTSAWNPLPAQLPLDPANVPPGEAFIDRRMGVLTVTLDHPEPDGALYDLTIPEAERSLPFQWSTMPARVTDQGVTFLFGSCFSRKDDKSGKLGAALKFLMKNQDASRPAFKMMIGDQVYQDWPPVLLTRRTPVRIYADRYEEFWADDAYRGALQACPNFFLCDDHEFWNDYPEFQKQLPITYGARRRKIFGDVANALYYAYQRCLNLEETEWTQFKIDPVSFFISDSRSKRDEVAKPGAQFFTDQQWAALEKWANELDGPGVFVIGQPPFQKDGDRKDHSLSNFPADYRRLLKVFSDAQGGNDRTPHNILVLSGDIHTGRLATGAIINQKPGNNRFDTLYEFIASPSSVLQPDGFGSTEDPPAKMPAENPVLKISQATDDLTTDNNIGHVRMSPGTNGRIQFDLTLWRVSPYSGLNYFKRGWDAIFHRQADVIRVFNHTIQLQ